MHAKYENHFLELIPFGGDEFVIPLIKFTKINLRPFLDGFPLLFILLHLLGMKNMSVYCHSKGDGTFADEETNK